MSASDKWGQHFVGCRRCEIDTFCPTGRALAERAAEEGLNALREISLREYLLSIADEHFEEDEHRRIVGAGQSSTERPFQKRSAGGPVEPPAPTSLWSTEELLARERAFMDAKLP